MRTRLHCIAPAALAWALIGWSVLSAPSAARAEDRPAARSSSRQPASGSGNKTGLSIGRLIAHKPEASQQNESQPAKPAVREGITVEKLWDRWKSGGGSPKSKAAPRSQESPEPDGNRPELQSRPPEEHLEAPQPAPAEGEFPVFRAGPPPQVSQPQAAPPPIQAPAAIAAPRPKAPPAQVPMPAVVPMPAAAPAEAPTSVMTRYETPVPADIPAVPPRLGSSNLSAPATPEARVRSTSGYLANEVRFGVVLRAPSRGASLDPTADILGEVQKPLPRSTLSSIEPQTVEPFDRTFSDDDSGTRPKVVQVRAEDTSRFRTMAPAPSAEISGRPAKLMPGAAGNVASAASSAALQQALRRYGKPADTSQHAPQATFDTQDEILEPPMQESLTRLQPLPEPELQPVPEPEVQTPDDDDASQRSVLLGGTKPLAIDRPGQPKSQGIRLKGLSKAMERSNSAGAVAGIDRTNHTIRVVFSKGPPPAVGEKLQVFQKVLFHRHLLGEFQVVGVQGNTVIARPTEKIDFESIVNGDEAAAMN